MDVITYSNPFTGKMAQMPVAMVQAYVPDSDLRLEDAAKVACIRDDEAASNLLLSIVGVQHPEVLADLESILEGTATDRLSVEPPVLR
jgi:hypothetical protein